MKYVLVPTYKLHPNLVQTYWQTLYMHDLLKYRLCEVDNPTWKDVTAMLSNRNMHFFSAVDPEAKIIAGECALERFAGLSAIIHYSIHPEYHGPKAVEIAKDGAQCLFAATRSENVPYISTLIGLTPETNKLAVRHIQKVGFKIQCILPKAIHLAYLNKYDNVVLSILERAS